jgi:hypothetical protein
VKRSDFPYFCDVFAKFRENPSFGLYMLGRETHGQDDTLFSGQNKKCTLNT